LVVGGYQWRVRCYHCTNKSPYAPTLYSKREID
jgi:hypothetical protein